MIIYSVTVSVEKAIADDWHTWMLEVHIPEVIATECFTSFSLHKIIEPVVDESMVTFNVQYSAKNMEVYELYRTLYAPKLQREHTKRYENRFVAFRTLLEKLA
jgi:hypothetical protein